MQRVISCRLRAALIAAQYQPISNSSMTTVTTAPSIIRPPVLTPTRHVFTATARRAASASPLVENSTIGSAMDQPPPPSPSQPAVAHSADVSLRPVKAYSGQCSYNLPRLVHHFRRATMLSPPGTTVNTSMVHDTTAEGDAKSEARTAEGRQGSSASVAPREFRYELQYPSSVGGKHSTLLKASHDAVLAVVMVQVLPSRSHIAVFGDGTLGAFDGAAAAGTTTLHTTQLPEVLAKQSLDADVTALRQFLNPFSEPKDPMLVLREPLTISRKYTTLDEVHLYRGANEPSLMAFATGAHVTFTAAGTTRAATSSSESHNSHRGHHDVPGTTSFGVGSGEHSTNRTTQQTSTTSHSSTTSTAMSYIDDDELDAIVLRHATAAEMLPFAFCLSELCQLRALNALLVPIASQVNNWKAHLAKAGTLPMSLQEARKRKAEVMRMASRQGKMAAARHKLFWEGANARSRVVLQNASDHYEVVPIHEELKAQMEAVTATLGYLCEEGHADTNHRLEWIVIALIFVEVLISLQEHVFRFGRDPLPDDSEPQQ